jgi:phosphatidylglycerophosphate synthase
MAASGDDRAVKIAVVLDAWRASRMLFGRSLLERNLKVCRRAGIERFVLECPPERRERVERALAKEAELGAIDIVDSVNAAQQLPRGLGAGALCLVVRGDVVFLSRDLKRLLEQYSAAPRSPAWLAVDGGGHRALFAVGALAQTLAIDSPTALELGPSRTPFAADELARGATEKRARRQIELRLVRALRFESVETDTFLARVLDRRISWPVTYVLAHTKVTPNQVTLANTALGLFGAALLAGAGYGWRVAGASLFVASIIIDGVDGELARAKLMESAAGERLDHITDNLVHIAVFCGIALGVYRDGRAPAMLYALGALLAGFGLCAVAVNYAFRRLGQTANKDWLARVERASGRDFAYLVLLLAALDRLEYFIWGAALGTYAAALLFYAFAKVQELPPGRRHARGSYVKAAEKSYEA